MSQTTQSTMFTTFSSQPSLSWADEMNDLADGEESSTLPTLPEWMPLNPLGAEEERTCQSAQVDAHSTSFYNPLESSSTYTEDHTNELAVGPLGEPGTLQANENSVDEQDGHLIDENVHPGLDSQQQHLSGDDTAASDEAEYGSSDQELSESSQSGDGDDSSEEEDADTDIENVQQGPSMTTSASGESESEAVSSEEEDDASSASGDDEDPSFAPYHPGWTKLLSPSINPNHSTPPEVNRWAFSPPIGYALQRDLDSVYLDEDCPNLVKPATLSCALLHTDSDGLSGYAFPYGARGLKRPLPQLFPRKNMVFPRSRAEVYQRSRLSHSEVIDYSPQDLQSVNSNASEHAKELLRNATPEEVEKESPACSEQSSFSGEEPSEHTASEPEGGDDLWSPLSDHADQGSISSVDQNECTKAGLQVSDKVSRNWDSISEPDIDTVNIFDLGDQEPNRDRFIKSASLQDRLAYLDLAVICTINLTDFEEGESAGDLSIPESVTSLEATSTPGLTTEVLDPTVISDYLYDLSSSVSQSLNDVSEIDTSSDADMSDDERSGGAAEEDMFDEVYELAVATALPDVNFVEEHVEDQQLDMIDIMHDLGDEEKKQVERVETEEKIGHLQGSGVGFFGGLMAAATFLWDCLNDRPLILDNP